MESSTEEIEHLRKILAIEKNTDFTQFREMVRKLPLSERKLKGYSWYPLRVTKTGFAIGDKAYVILERSGSKEDPNQFRSGMQVTFFTQAAHVKNSERSGIIQFMTDMSMKVILNTPDLPDWINAGSLGIDLDFDERSYLEMEKALVQLQSAINNRSAELRDILLGYLPSDRAQDLEKIDVAVLNPAQNKAVNHILATRDISILHGPPGTGKTTTLVQGIREMAMRENEILVTAPSNTAVDLLTEKLAETGLNVVRIGNISRVDETILHHTLDYRLAHHPETRQIKKVRIEAIEARKQLEKLDGKFGAEVRDRKSELRREARDLQSWANRLENQLVTKILFEADVITCTLVGSANKVLEGMKFTTVFIDEAAQALEPATWIPILKADKVVLAGDPYQLPPTVKSMDAQKAGLNVTLIEKAIERLEDVQVLDTQYRMHVDIMGFSNEWFYGNKLKADQSVSLATLPGLDAQIVQFIDTAGCGFEEESKEDTQRKRSLYNSGEYFILREHWHRVKQQLLEGSRPSIAIISPYREQVNHIREQVISDTEWDDQALTINTIDGFQGLERDIIYISLVRSNPEGEIGFLKDYRRLNVALTRAKKRLVVIGDSATIGQDKFYASFIQYCESLDTYRSAWGFMAAQ